MFHRMDSLDTNVLIDIAVRVGNPSVMDMAGMLSASKFFHSIVCSPLVLQKVSLSPALSNPTLINIDSSFRTFFSRCVSAKNPDACYLESLRLAGKEGLAESALSLLYTIPSLPPLGLFARGLLELCLGFYPEALTTIQELIQLVGSFSAADAIGSQFFRHLLQIGPEKKRSHSNTFHYVDIPHCVSTGCGIASRCRNCFFYWFGVMYLLLC